MRPVPKTCPNVGRKSPLPIYGRQFCQTVQPQFVNALIPQPLIFITPWHLPCSLDQVVRKLEILIVQIHRLREEQEVANHESDLSKTDKL